MTQTALPAPRAGSRRSFFGLFDADGWAWAGVKAVFWFIVLIVMLGYIPDRAYYFTVQSTVDIGVLKWAPINFCPPENETVPCPAPAGASLPWHPAPAELQLPASRTDGVAAVIGSTYLYAGGSDGQAASTATFISHAVGLGNLDKWAAAPAMPEARTDAASVVVGNTLYVIGGSGPDGKPTSSVFTLTIANDGTPGAWKTDAALALPAPRSGASAVAVSDGIVVLGGTDGAAATKSVWKSQASAQGVLGAWAEQYPLAQANVDGYAAHVGDVIFVIGGRNEKNEVVATVQQLLVGGPNATVKDPNIIAMSRVSEQTNLPGPRTNLAGFVANGSIYVTGGSDGVASRTETLWAIPDAGGVIPAWNHLAQTDLGEGIQGASGVAAGSYAFILGGQTAKGVTAGSARANMAPKQPFFQVGLLGLTIPALKLDGEVGQQIGYLNAATVGAVNFIVMILIGVAFNHKARTRELLGKLRRRR
jgi:N-acetylneuraminic acid mutarotase